MTLGGALFQKPVTKLSELEIDADRAWPMPWIAAHTDAWAPTLTRWHYRQRITLAGSPAGALTGYQIRFQVYNDRGISSGNTVFVNGLAADTFVDLRFTNNAGVVLPHFIEPNYGYSIGFAAYVWVRVDSIPASPGTVPIWLYYGHEAANNISSGVNTFEVFDDFDRGNLIGWTERDPVACTWTAPLEAMREGAAGCQGQMAATGDGGILTRDVATFENALVEAWVRLPDADSLASCLGGFVFAWLNNSNYYVLALEDTGATERVIIREITAGSPANLATGALTIAATTWYKLRARIVRSGANLIIAVDVDEINRASFTDTSPRATPNMVGIWCASTNLSRVYVDTFFVARLVSPAPAVVSYGAQESYRASYGITNVKELAVGMSRGDILVSDGTVLVRVPPGAVGMELASSGPGIMPTWRYAP